jgi:hypothetical protein
MILKSFVKDNNDDYSVLHFKKNHIKFSQIKMTLLLQNDFVTSYIPNAMMIRE